MKNVRKIYLTIIDEVGTLSQQLFGAADQVTRHITGIDKPWGGIDLMLSGDFLQLPPVKAEHIFAKTADKDDKNYKRQLAALKIWEAINWYSFLIDVWRQKYDPPFLKVLHRMQYGVNSEADIELLNTRVIANLDMKDSLNNFSNENQIDYFAPMVISDNKNRCLYNNKNVYGYAKFYKTTVYECVATSPNHNNQKLINRLKNTLLEQQTSKIHLVFQFHLCSHPINITKRPKDTKSMRILSNGTLGFVIGFIRVSDNKPIMWQNINDDDNNNDYNIRQTLDGLTIKTFKINPHYLIIKIRDCNRQLVKDYPIGVCLLPRTDSWKININLPHAIKTLNMTVKQFPIISSYGLTPEKLQGVTIKHDFYISKIMARSSQSFYVVFSRVEKLMRLYLTEPLNMAYVRKFLPSLRILEVVKNMIDKIMIPSYITKIEMHDFILWKNRQYRYIDRAISFNTNKRKSNTLIKKR